MGRRGYAMWDMGYARKDGMLERADVRYSEPEAHAPLAQIPDIRYWMFDTRYSIFSTQYPIWILVTYTSNSHIGCRTSRPTYLLPTTYYLPSPLPPLLFAL